MDFMPVQTNSYYNIALPGRSVLNFSRSTRYRFADNNKTLQIRNRDMQTEIFDPVIERVLTLLDQQLKRAKDDGKLIDAIVIVGTFSGSKYLQHCIKEKYLDVCDVFHPDEYNSLFSYGAAYYGLILDSRNSKHTGFSLSLEVQAPFDKTIMHGDASSKKMRGPNGSYYAKNRLSYFIKKDQEVKKESRCIYSQIVQIEYPKSAIIGK